MASGSRRVNSVDNASDWPDEWAIAIYVGDSPFHLKPRVNCGSPVITRRDVTDIPAAFVADPFMIQAGGNWYMFFETMNRETKKGEIGLAVSQDAISWKYRSIVLREPYHLSYPYVFEWHHQYYMIPETYQAGGVRLYKAVEFPTQWAFAGTLLAGPYYVDSSIFRYDEKWWLFTDASPNARHDTLRLFWTEDLWGRWTEHPHSPIISSNPEIARPAGRVIVIDGRPIRFTQACYPVYGTEVRAFEITELTITTYQERAIGPNPLIGATGSGWNKSGMHHIDAHLTENGQWLACVDGFSWKDN
jgi:hypothetical protein